MANGFIDKARITVRAGNGGNGAVAFHREKYIAAGGPDGGDGGDGGSIIVRVDDNMSTLMDFRYKRKYVAGNGVDGQGGRKSGKDGQSLTIRVPRGLSLIHICTAPQNDIVYPLSGMVFCADCKASMLRRTVRRGNKTFRYYVCSANKRGNGCSSHSFEQSKLEQTVLRAITKQIDIILDTDELLNAMGKSKIENAHIRRCFSGQSPDPSA